MQTYKSIENHGNLLGRKFVVCIREGGANTTPYFLVAHFAKRNTKFGDGGKRARAFFQKLSMSNLVGLPGIEPGPYAPEAYTLPLCYSPKLLIILRNIFS